MKKKKVKKPKMKIEAVFSKKYMEEVRIQELDSYYLLKNIYQ